MLLFPLISLLLFFLMTLGLAWPLAARLRLDPAEKLGASAVLSLLAVYLAAFAIYLLGLPRGAGWLLPVLAVAGLIAGRRALAAVLADPEARMLLIGQLLIAGWCMGWLALVISYSGGGWNADWFEHWQRARFFVEHWSLDTQFLGYYSLPARPPLANVLTGALLEINGVTFSGYQLATTLYNCLAFLPAALLARRFCQRPGFGNPSGHRLAAIAALAVLLMLNPSFIQNSTFAWTKLITAFFILSGLYFFLRAHDSDPPPAAGPLCAASLAAGILAHYSAGPYVLLLAGAWFGLSRHRWREPSFWRQTGFAALIGGLILATWFGWSLAVYGAHTTLLSNSSVTVKAARSGNQLLKIALNLRDTVVPHFLRPLDMELIVQRSPWGYWRDWFFQLYQVNLFFIFGSVGWLALLRELVRAWPVTASRSRWFWAVFCGGVILLGVAVHGARDTWGLAHICLQPLLVLGLAYLAARWPGLGRKWRLALVAGVAFDFCLGIALHFGVQSFALDRWFAPARTVIESAATYSPVATMNLFGKLYGKVEFFGDALHAPAALVLALLAGILTLAVTRAARRPD